MRKVLRNIKSTLVMLAAIAGVTILSVSCQYDDTAIWEKFDEIEKELADIRQQLETELNAIKDMVNGLVTVTDVKQQQDGSKQIVLSDGTKINVYPKGDEVPAGLVTTTVVDGVLVWAQFDGLGNAQPIYVNGKVVPVAEIAPMTQVVDGVIEVSFDNGATWIQTGYTESVADSIIKDVRVVYSDWRTDEDGNKLALYCLITLADGSEVKVGMQNGRIILPYDSIFAAYGETLPFALDAEDAADFLVTTPKGWECEVNHSAKNGTMTLYFVAPTLEAIESGAAVASGVVKLMVTFNNGSSAIASIKVSTNPAKVYFTLDGVHIEAGYGANYVLCGIIPATDFKMNTVMNWCTQTLAGTTVSYVSQVSFMEDTSVYLTYEELRSQGMKVGTDYIFWYTVPRTNEDGDLYLTETEFFTENYTHSSVAFQMTNASFFDVDVKLTVKNSANYMLGYAKADEFDAAYIAQYYTEHPDYLTATRENMEYEGSFVELFTNGAALEYGTEYVAYFLAENSKHVYLKDNVLSWRFSTQDYTRDGSMEVSVIGEPTVAYNYIEMTLNTAEDHIMMFYTAMPSYMASAYPTDDYVIDMLLEEGTKVKSNEAVVARYAGVQPGTKLTFFAVAVDAEGKIGKPFKGEYTTKEIVYNDIELTAELVDYKIDNTLIRLNAEGAESYAYILCKTSDSQWKEKYGGTAKKAGEYIIMNMSASDVYKTTDSRYALVDGCIALSGLEMDVEYVVVVMAVDAEGVCSAAASCYFKPIANIGNVVYRSEAQWEESKPTVSILAVEDNPHLFMSFSWSCLPAPHTKIYTAAIFRSNLVNEELGTNIDTVEKLIAEIMTCCDTGGMSEQGKSFEWQESGIYLREWIEWEDIDGDNYIEEVYHCEERDAPYIFFPYGSKDNTFIYTTWVGEDGNFCEPFAIDPMTGEEVSLW
ncbi:MAG: hypothetical protein IKV29_03160 [Alistipes sp.]|nr:hypothetical protein [Alistipes sp.]